MYYLWLPSLYKGSSVVVTKTTQLSKSKVFAVWPFTRAVPAAAGPARPGHDPRRPCSLNPARSTGGRKCGPEGVLRGRLCSNGVYATAGAIASRDSWLLTRQGKVDSASGRGEAEVQWELWKDWSWEVTLDIGQGLSILRRVTVRFTVQTGILLRVKSSTTQLHYHSRCIPLSQASRDVCSF